MLKKPKIFAACSVVPYEHSPFPLPPSTTTIPSKQVSTSILMAQVGKRAATQQRNQPLPDPKSEAPEPLVVVPTVDVTPLLRAQLAAVRQAFSLKTSVISEEGLKQFLAAAEQTTHTGVINACRIIPAVPMAVLEETVAAAEGESSTAADATFEMLSISHLIGGFGIDSTGTPMWRVRSCPVPLGIPSGALAKELLGEFELGGETSSQHPPSTEGHPPTPTAPSIPAAERGSKQGAKAEGAGKHSKKSISNKDSDAVASPAKSAAATPAAIDGRGSLLAALAQSLGNTNLNTAVMHRVDRALSSAATKWLDDKAAALAEAPQEASTKESVRGAPLSPRPDPAALLRLTAGASHLTLFVSSSVAEAAMACRAKIQSDETAFSALCQLYSPPSIRGLRNLLGKVPRVPTPIVGYELPVFVAPPVRGGRGTSAHAANPEADGSYLLACSPHTHNGACTSVGECLQAITDLDRAIRRRCRLATDRHFRASFPPWGAYNAEACENRTLDQSVRLALVDVSANISHLNLLPHPGSGIHRYPSPHHPTPHCDANCTNTSSVRLAVRQQSLADLIAAQRASLTDMDVAIVDPLAHFSIIPGAEGNDEESVAMPFFATLSELVHDVAVMKREGMAVLLDLRRLLFELPVSPPTVEVHQRGTAAFTAQDAPVSELLWIQLAAWCDIDGLLLPPPRGGHATRAYNELLRCEATIAESNNGYCSLATLLAV